MQSIPKRATSSNIPISLDHEVMELAAPVPAKFKVPEGGKYVLREATRRVIPKGVIDRPKGYFPVPALRYLRGAFLQRVREVLADPRARQRVLFKPAYVDKLLVATGGANHAAARLQAVAAGNA
jgi:asparagine synthetase B (glutamine-hydrolysing)